MPVHMIDKSKQTNIMITPITQAAIAVLNDIYGRECTARTDACHLTEQDLDILLSKLLKARLIKLSNQGNPRNIRSYSPVRSSCEVSLLDILETIGEHLNCNRPTTEEFYMRYGKAAQKLGIVNYITRKYLHEIKLFEL